MGNALSRRSFDGEEPPELPGMLRRLLIVGTGFAGVHQFVANVASPILLRVLDGGKFGALTKAEQHDVNVYVAAVMHHLIVIGPSVHSLVCDALAPADKPRDYSSMLDVAGISLGYFTGDSLALLPEWVQGKSLDFLVHHAAGFILILGPVALSTVALRWVPWFLQTEITTIFLASMYYLRKTGRAEGKLYAALSYAFAGLFFLLRCGVLPAGVNSLLNHHQFEKEKFASIRMVFQAVVLLQFYWASKIAKQLVERLQG